MNTIKQVAELAGVSIKTVSRVINHDDQVKQETRQRVEAAITQLGYIPNLNARTMRTQRSFVIGFVTDQIATTPYAVDVIRGAQQSAWQNNRMLLVVNTQGDTQIETRSIKMMLERRVEGIIYAAMYHRQAELPEALRYAKAVLVNCFAANSELPAVVPDEFKGGFEATEILISRGFRKIAFINLPENSLAAQGRLAGYQHALEIHKFPYRPDWVQPGLKQIPGKEVNQSFEVATTMLKSDEPPTAFFCGNDRIAMRVYDAIRQQGLKIQDDIGVIGFDNLEVIAENLSPGLSSMALPHEAMGHWAVEHLLQPELNQSQTYPIHRIPCPFVDRGSC